MHKSNYITPEIEVVEACAAQTILTGSSWTDQGGSGDFTDSYTFDNFPF